MRGSPNRGRRALPVGVLLAAAWLLNLMGAPGVEAALPRGELRLWVEQRFERWGPYGVARERDGTLTHLDGELFPINRGAWSLWVDAAADGEQARVEAREVPSRWGRVSLSLGDHTAQDAGAFPLRNEFQRPVWIRGATLGVRRGDLRIEARGGSLTRREGLIGQGRTSAGAEALGLGIAGGWGGGRIWELAWDRQDETASGLPAAQQARITLGRRAPLGWSWMGEARASEGGLGGGSGMGFWGGGEYTGARASIGGHLRRVDAGYRGLGLNRAPLRNQWGVRLDARARPHRRFHLGSAVDWSQDLTRREDGLPPERRFALQGFLTAVVHGPFFLSGRSAYRTRSTRDPDSLMVDQGTFSGGGELGWRAGRSGGGLSYTRGLFRDPVGDVGDWHEDRHAAHVHYSLGRRLRAGLEASRVERRLPDGTWTSRERRAGARLDWSSGSGRQIWVAGAREIQEADVDLFFRDQWQLAAGWEQPLFWELMLQVETLAYLRAGDRDPESTRLNLRLSRRMTLRGGRPGVAEGLPEFGVVSGVAFEDRNGNGVQDSGEPGVRGALIRLGSGSEIVTDPEGAYQLEDVAVGLDYVILDLMRLPARFLAPEETRIPVRLEPRQGCVIDFPLCPGAAVSGRVVVPDADGALVGVSDVLVKVRDSHHDMFTDADGRFVIQGLRPGPVTLEVIEWTLPHETRLTGRTLRELRLPAGGMVTCPLFRLEKTEIPVLQHFRPSPSS